MPATEVPRQPGEVMVESWLRVALIVTSKLLTGFDWPILQAMYLDKPMKDHNLLQAICRTNRTLHNLVLVHSKRNSLMNDKH